MLPTSLKRTLLAGGAALALGGATIGHALAQQTPAPPPNRQGHQASERPMNGAFLQALAGKLGITVDGLRQAITEARSEVGPQRRGDDGRRPFGRSRPGPLGVEVRAAAQSIGITVDQLRQELPGKSLAEVARARGKNPADVATALKNASNHLIDQAVTNGRLTAERATDMKQRLGERIDKLMNRTTPQGLGEFRRGPHRGPGADQPARGHPRSTGAVWSS